MIWRLVPGGLVLAAAISPLSDADMWWHLAAGRMILDGQFPITNTLSHTFPEYPWRFTQWLFGALIALAENLGGFLAVQFIVCGFAAGTFLLVMTTIRRDVPQAKWFLVLPLVAIGVLSARSRFDPRGDLASLLGLAAVHYLWVIRPKRLPLCLFLTACVWSNLHSGVIFGVLGIALFGCAAIFERDRESIRDALSGGIAFFVGSLVNPFLHYNYLYILENFEIARRFPFPIAELQHPSWRNPAFAAFAVLVLLGLLPALVRRRHRDVLLIAGFGAMGLSAKRFVAYLAVLALPGVVKSFHDYRDWTAARYDVKFLSALLYAPILATAFYIGFLEFRSNPAGLGADLRKYPARTSEFLLSKGFTGRMYNSFNQGGFLAWRLYPNQRVFIDGRGNAYPWDHFTKYAGFSPHSVAVDVLDTYNVDYAIVERNPGSADGGPVFAALGWKLVHIEGAAYLFVRPGSPDAMRSRAEVFHTFFPWENQESLLRSARANPGAMHAELLRIDPRSVLSDGDFNRLGFCAYSAGDPSLSLEFFSAGISRHPANASLRLNLAFVLESSGRIEEAAKQYRQIVDKDTTSFPAKEARRRLEAIGGTPLPRTGPAR